MNTKLKKIQIDTLFKIMKNLIFIRDNNEQADKLNRKDFELWIKELNKDYIKNKETCNFYIYVENNVLDIICN